jgi:hypothetical protein
VPVGVYDIRPRSLSVGNKQITISGAGELKILAANVTFQPGARFIATGTDGNTTVTLDATGTIDLQSMGTSKSKIDVSGNFGGGTINLHSVGNLSINGTLISNATNLLGFGGPINVKSDTGNITVTGDPSEGLKSFGNAQGGGGSITIDAPLGSLSISTQLVPKGGDCGSCEVNLNAGTSITTTAQGVLDLRASGIGDGGFVSVSAGTDINMAGNILANGSSDDTDGGTGGDVLIAAGGSVTMGGRIELNGAGQDAVSANGFSVDGDSGSSDISAGTFIQMNGPMFGISKGFGQGDEFSFDAVGNISFAAAAEIDFTSDNFGGDITVLSDALVTINSRLKTAATVDALHPSALGGTVDIEACQVNLTTNASLVATGPGGSPSGANFVVASTGMTIAGQLTATAENELTFRTNPPAITRVPLPLATLVQDLNLPCCGVACPITTTTTSTTSSTSTSRPTTTTSPTTSTSRPTTTSTSSSTSTSRPTTTTTSSTTSSSTSSSTSTSTSSSTTSSTSTSTSRPTTTSTTSSTSTSTSSSTSTTLIVGCPASPASGCQTGGKIQIQVNEKTFGKEQIKIKIDKLVSSVPLSFFGDPVTGTTGYAVCIYNESQALVATLRVDRPQQQCGTRPCWKIAGGTSYKYADKLLASYGMQTLQMKSGAAGTGKFAAKAKRNLAKSLGALLPTGVAPQLTGNRHATVQLMSSNAGCLTGTVDNVRDATPTLFKGTTP